MSQVLVRCAIVILLGVVSACSSGPAVVSEEFESQIDTSVTFPQLLDAPRTYSGRTVLLGGEILSAKRMSGGMQLEILQLPVSNNDPPAERRSEFQGRFLAMNRTVIDAAALPPGTRVTVIGSVRAMPCNSWMSQNTGIRPLRCGISMSGHRKPWNGAKTPLRGSAFSAGWASV